MEIEHAAGLGISKLFDYGAAMIVLVLVGLAMAFTIRYLLKRCDERFDQALVRHETTTAKVAEVLDRNTTAYVQTTAIMADIKQELRNMNR
jgi:hypothetical protein